MTNSIREAAENLVKFSKVMNALYPTVTPTYKKPHWWQFSKKAQIKWMDKEGLRYKLVDKKGNVIGGNYEKD